jgi:demethylmenaquinone methyltransferase/2-methoxy-6-polyprenyl-1,4-benzoquinol methylase
VSKLAAAFTSPEQKRRHVRRLFSTIADRYDLITVVLSWGQDRVWKRRLIRESGVRRGDRVVDLACGTGDIAGLAARAGATVTGLDITLRMIELARGKAVTESAGARSPMARFAVADMMSLPLPDASADVVTTGYGLRNVPELGEAIGEIGRVLRPGGRLVSLDFNRPQAAVIRWPYLAYLTVVGSALGWLLHRDPDTYRYIPESLRRYPGAHGVAAMLKEHGFADVRVIPILGGLMTIHVATRR